MEFIRARLNRGIQHGSAGATEFGAEIGGLYFELLDSVHRRQHNEVGAVQKVDRVGVVVDAIQHVVVLRRAGTIGRKSTGCGIASCVRLGRVDASCELGQKGEVPPVQRQIVYVLLVDDLTDGSVLRLKQWSGTGHFDSFADCTSL